ncbi:MAG: hypothetical protein AAF415_10955 [Pseudomonadota bacterium]
MFRILIPVYLMLACVAGAMGHLHGNFLMWFFIFWIVAAPVTLAVAAVAGSAREREGAAGHTSQAKLD